MTKNEKISTLNLFGDKTRMESIPIGDRGLRSLFVLKWKYVLKIKICHLRKNVELLREFYLNGLFTNREHKAKKKSNKRKEEYQTIRRVSN